MRCAENEHCVEQKDCVVHEYEQIELNLMESTGPTSVISHEMLMVHRMP